MTEVLEELSECVSGSSDPIKETEKKMLNDLIDDFISKLKPIEQRVFLCRYWYADSVKDIAKRFGFSESKVINFDISLDISITLLYNNAITMLWR